MWYYMGRDVKFGVSSKLVLFVKFCYTLSKEKSRMKTTYIESGFELCDDRVRFDDQRVCQTFRHQIPQKKVFNGR